MSAENNIMVATFIVKGLEGEIRNQKIGVTYRNIKISGEYHLEGKGWLEFNILLPVGKPPSEYKLKFIGRSNQYRAAYYGIRQAMHKNISALVIKAGAAFAYA